MIERIRRALAAAEGKEPDELTVTLQEHVDADAIRLLAEHDSRSWSLMFELPEHTIEVAGEGSVVVDGTRQRISASER